jgi:hypothetical protein
MKDDIAANKSMSDSETTGLPWLKSWKSAYFFVLASFVLWVGLLIALTECGT